MEQLVTWATFCLAVFVLCLVRPRAGRYFLGIFYLVMAVAINIVLVLVAPHLFVALGTDAAVVPIYRWFFVHVVAAPVLFGLLAAVYEIAIGLLLLHKGKWVKWGLIGGIVHLIGITPVGVWTLPNPILAAAMAYLLSKDDDVSLIERGRALLSRERHSPSPISPVVG